MPTRSVPKKAGPFDLSLINKAIISIGRLNKTIRVKAKIKSKIRFTILKFKIRLRVALPNRVLDQTLHQILPPIYHIFPLKIMYLSINTSAKKGSLSFRLCLKSFSL